MTIMFYDIIVSGHTTSVVIAERKAPVTIGVDEDACLVHACIFYMW